MSGMTILTQHSIVEYQGQVWVVLAAIAFILTISFFIVTLICHSTESLGLGVIFLLALFFFIIVGEVRYKEVSTS
nr:MAG TPA: hypothetical protein [Caudoviricetes sp.]